MTALTPTGVQRDATARRSPSRAGDQGDTADDRLRVLQVSVACHPETSMETRIGWRRAVHAATRHDVTVLHGRPDHQALLTREAERLGLAATLRFIPVERCLLGDLLSQFSLTYYAGYRRWHRCAGKAAHRLHRERPFDLVHQTTFCGFREPGDGWRLGAPFVWGPVGGTQHFPYAYLGQLSPGQAVFEVCRNLVNSAQLRYSPRVRAATRRAAVLVAATQRAADDLYRTQGRRTPVRLETSLDYQIASPRPARKPGQPLKILWAGRLRAWKTLPLLLRALPGLASDVDWRLRVLGVGSSEAAWRRLADRLGIGDRIEWLGWPTYAETLPHYDWADAFAFTSMRDTSGTGLLEALAAGAPVVGVDHQGAADIMTADCSLAAPVGRPAETIRAFTDALTRLDADPALWKRLSDGALRRAAEFSAEAEAADLLQWYDTAARAASEQSAARRAGVPAGDSRRFRAAPASTA